MGIEKIEIKEDKTVRELIAELNLSSVPILLELEGEVFYPDDRHDRRLKAGDTLMVIPIVAGG